MSRPQLEAPWVKKKKQDTRCKHSNRVIVQLVHLWMLFQRKIKIEYSKSKIREVNMLRNKSHEVLARSMWNQKVCATHATILDINKRIVGRLTTIKIKAKGGMQKEVMNKNKNIFKIRKKILDSNEVTAEAEAEEEERIITNISTKNYQDQYSMCSTFLCGRFNWISIK